jgi:hypothetical protein
LGLKLGVALGVGWGWWVWVDGGAPERCDKDARLVRLESVNHRLAPLARYLPLRRSVCFYGAV